MRELELLRLCVNCVRNLMRRIQPTVCSYYGMMKKSFTSNHGIIAVSESGAGLFTRVVKAVVVNQTLGAGGRCGKENF